MRGLGILGSVVFCVVCVVWFCLVDFVFGFCFWVGGCVLCVVVGVFFGFLRRKWKGVVGVCLWKW